MTGILSCWEDSSALSCFSVTWIQDRKVQVYGKIKCILYPAFCSKDRNGLLMLAFRDKNENEKENKRKYVGCSESHTSNLFLSSDSKDTINNTICWSKFSATKLCIWIFIFIKKTKIVLILWEQIFFNSYCSFVIPLVSQQYEMG